MISPIRSSSSLIASSSSSSSNNLNYLYKVVIGTSYYINRTIKGNKR